MRRGDDSSSTLERLTDFLSSSSPGVRRSAAMLVDFIIVLEALVLALLFRFEGAVPASWWESFWPFAVFSALVFVMLLYEAGVYKNILRYTGVYQGVKVASATAIAAGILLIANLGLDTIWSRPVPLSVIIVGSVFAYVQLVAVRLYPRVFYEFSLREVGHRDQALIVGDGEAGVMLARQLWRTPDADLRPVGFISEDPERRGEQIEGIPFMGAPEDIEEVVQREAIDQILIAMPRADSEQIDRIWRECVKTTAEVKMVPELTEFLQQGKIQLRDLQIQDLLGRDPVEIDLQALSEFVSGKRVLVTGAGGSIGSELSRQLSRLGPSRLVLLDQDESSLYYMEEELVRDGYRGAEMFVCDVTNAGRVQRLFEQLKPQLVFHAAAYKHVPLMELHSSEAIINNVGGTLNLARASGEHEVEKFINVSTDKAVRPANVMGATKRFSEVIVRAASAAYPSTIYASVRFGNVLGSRGSVVPTFQRQIEAGGPVTVTHPEMTRYFMIIPEAVSLILQTGAMADSYGTFVLEMGRPVKILDLARKMIEIMGAGDTQIKFTGLRPGEKLREELSEDSEQRASTEHSMVFRLTPRRTIRLDMLELAEKMASLAREGEYEDAAELLRDSVPNYPTIEEASFPQEVSEIKRTGEPDR